LEPVVTIPDVIVAPVEPIVTPAAPVETVPVVDATVITPAVIIE